ncbi:MAG TPA: tetratricopeptide repeat protein, partial [Chthonomonadaceae bacterium]|nr:tetratricopeptide repeat protein [Chthonomonadaceae bacterium]
AGLLHGLGNAALGLGDPEAAQAYYRESLERSREAGDRQRLADALEGLAGLALARRQPERAARLLGMDEAIRDSLGIAVNPFDRPFYERHLAAARAALGAETFAAAWAEGGAMPLDAAVTYALE